MEDWAVVRLNTNNGERIGIAYTDESLPEEIIESGLSFEAADERSRELASELNVTLFDNDLDVAI